jgi:hypothetical protein
MSVPDDRWIPVGLGHGPVCQVCGEIARWMRRTSLATVDRVPVTVRLWRCDTHARAATAGRPPCHHHAGPCQVCPGLADADPLAFLDPYRSHRTGACP